MTGIFPKNFLKNDRGAAFCKKGPPGPLSKNFYDFSGDTRAWTKFADGPVAVRLSGND
jgi:hypothetical protein